jgi:ribosome-associated protein
MPDETPTATPATTTQETLRKIVQALDDKKAGDLRVLRVSAQSSITDYLVLATGTSEPHLRALRVELEKVLDGDKMRIAGMDSSEGSGWTVVDAYQVMIHLFTPDKRDAYRLEQLWNDAEDIPVRVLLGLPEVVPVVAPATPKPVRAPKAPVAKVEPQPKPKPKAKSKAKAKPAPKAKKTVKKAAKAVKKAAPAKKAAKPKAVKKTVAKKAPAKKAAAKKSVKKAAKPAATKKKK